MTQKPTTTTTRAENSAGLPIPEGKPMNLPATNTTHDIATTGGDAVGTTNDRGIHQQGQRSDWSPAQRDELRALMDAGDASDGDLAMLQTVCHRSGLDPFLKQVYLVGRKTKTGGYRGEPERWETKWTVQTGIDGFRTVTHRYAETKGAAAVIGRPIYYDAEGNQHPIWLKAWGNPAAAEVTVAVGNSEATGVATWDEYVQTKKNGDPNSMWDKFGPTMLAKCAEAQAHRRVCPLSAGMYEPAEIGATRAVAQRMDTAQESGSGALGALEAARQRVHARRHPEPGPEPAQDADVVDVVDGADIEALVDAFITDIDAASTMEKIREIAGEAKASKEQGTFTDAQYERIKAHGNAKAKELEEQ